MGQIVQLDKTDASKKRLSLYFKENEYLLPDPISQHVDLYAYASKLIDKGSVFAYLEDDNICGVVCGYMNDVENHKSFLQILIVSEDAQGKKLGTQLINKFIDVSRINLQCGKCYLTVDKCNQKAYSVYKHLGYIESDIMHDNLNKQIMEMSF